MNRILSAPREGTGDDVYKFANAINPREVGVDALNAGALTDEEFMMAEEFMNAMPKEAHKGFIESLIKEPRATIKSVIETLFGGGQMSNDSGSSFDNLVDRTLSGTGTQLKGPLSNSELEMLLRSGDEGLGALGSALGSIGSGSTSNAELDAYRNAMNVEGSGAMEDSKGSISDMELMRIVDSRDGYQPPDSTNLKGPFSEKEIGSMQSTRPLPDEERLYQLRRGR